MAVILAAGMGTRLAGVTGGRIPKAFLEVGGRSLIERSLDLLFAAGVEDVVIATGHLRRHFEELAARRPGVRTVFNPEYATTGSMASLAAAAGETRGTFLLLEGDLLYEARALEVLLAAPQADCMLLSGFTRSGDEVWVETDDGRVAAVSKRREDLGAIAGELTGLNKISQELLAAMLDCHRARPAAQYHYENAMADAGRRVPVAAVKVDDLVWAEIDDASHLARVEREVLPRLREKEGAR